MGRRTKIVATLGPASDGPEVLRELLRAGTDVVRLNLSHGDLDEHLHRLRATREAARDVGRHIGVLADLPGPKMRAGNFDDPVVLLEGAMVDLAPGSGLSTEARIHVPDYPSLLEDIAPGDGVIVGDGAISLRIDRVGESSASAVVVTGGRVQGSPGIHLPSERLRLSAPTEEDFRLVEQLRGAEIDFFAVSFVRNADDVRELKAAVGAGPLVVAKIETTAAVVDLRAILDAADAVMVARGDLGIECSLEDVPHLQKQIIRSSVEAGIPVITATQMLESMIQSPAPTRAEASDVANAVFDGTDALMLSGETAIGHDPVLVVRTMARIAERAEAEADYSRWGGRLGRLQRLTPVSGPEAITAAMTHAAWQAAADTRASAVICCTRSGRTARGMARFRPGGLLLGLSPSARTARQLALSWGVLPLSVEEYRSTDELVWCAVEAAVASGLVHQGDVVAVLAGAPESGDGATDVLRLVRLS